MILIAGPKPNTLFIRIVLDEMYMPHLVLLQCQNDLKALATVCAPVKASVVIALRVQCVLTK